MSRTPKVVQEQIDEATEALEQDAASWTPASKPLRCECACGMVQLFARTAANQAQEAPYDAGWRRINGRWVCPACYRKRQVQPAEGQAV